MRIKGKGNLFAFSNEFSYELVNFWESLFLPFVMIYNLPAII